MIITLQDVLDCQPCYGPTKVRELAGDQHSWSPYELLQRSDVPVGDRVWLGAALLARRDRARLVAFAEDCVFRARVSADAATNAATNAAAYAANVATNAAATAYAAANAASYAANAAAYAAATAYAYAYAYAYAAERERQVRDLIMHLSAP